MQCHFKDYSHISNFVLVLFLNEISILSSRKVIKGNSNGKDSLIYIKRFSTLQLSFKGINKIVFLPGHINYTCLGNRSILTNCFIIVTHYIPAFYRQPWHRRCPRDHHKQSPLCFLVSQLHALFSKSTLQPNVRRLFQLLTLKKRPQFFILIISRIYNRNGYVFVAVKFNAVRKREEYFIHTNNISMIINHILITKETHTTYNSDVLIVTTIMHHESSMGTP